MVKTLATVQISELTAISTATTDDNFIINDGNAATRRITFADLVTSVANQAITFTQDIAFSGATSGIIIDELDDVDTSTAAPTSGQVLSWNGTNWVPADDSTSLAFELGSGEIINRVSTRGYVFKLRDTYDVNKIILNTASGDIDSQGNLSGAEIQVNGAQIKLADLSDGGFLTTLTGVSAGDANLGTFSGSTISDNLTIKAALQSIETSLEAIDIDTDDLASLSGIAENTTNLGTFTGSTIADNVAVKVALQSLETLVELKADASAITNVDNTSDANKPVSTATQTALDLKATLANPTFSGVLTARDSVLRQDAGHAARFLSPSGTDLQLSFKTGITGSGEDVLITLDDGNNDFQIRTMQSDGDFVVKTNDTEALRVNASSQQVVIGEGKLVLGSTAVSATAAELNHVAGVTSAVQTQIDAKSAIDSPTFTTKIESPEFHSAGGHLKFKAATNDIVFYPNNIETLQITRSGTDCRFTSNGGTGTFKFNQDVTQRPGSSVTPSANGDLSVEATSNTTLTFKMKGDDGVVRSGTITLS